MPSYSHKELADFYARGGTAGKGSRMFIEGETIYSHKRHFPIATRISEITVLVNTDHYSVSTGRHKRLVRNALEQLEYNIIEILNCDLNKAKEQLESNDKRIAYFLNKIKRARTKQRVYLETVNHLTEQNCKLREIIGYTMKDLVASFARGEMERDEFNRRKAEIQNDNH